jgi:hypothetical protein
MEAPYLSNPNGARGQGGPTQCVSDGQQELWWTFEKARIGRHERAWRQRNNGCYRNTVRVAGGRMRQNAGEMMMQGAALIVGIGGAMIVLVVTASAVDVVMMSVTSNTGAVDVVRDILFACHGMLEMDAGQRRDTRKLGYKEQPENPPAK